MTFFKPLLVAAAISIVTSVFAVTSAAATAAAASVNTAQTVPAAAKINVNTARAKDLQNVKGLDLSLARSIVAFRKNHGEFKSLDDLARVRKLSKLQPAELKAIEEQLSIQ